MDALSLSLSIVGIVASVVGVFYAALAARRSDSLLRRLVVYPFRELDVAFARLNEGEQSVVKTLFDRTQSGSAPLTETILAEVSAEFPDAGSAMMTFLVRENWLRRSRGGSLVVKI